MSKSRIVLVVAIAVVSIGLTLTAGGTSMRPLSPKALAHLSVIQQSPAAAGPAVYEGSVFALD